MKEMVKGYRGGKRLRTTQLKMGKDSEVVPHNEKSTGKKNSFNLHMSHQFPNDLNNHPK